MSEPTFENSKNRIEKFCKIMMNQSLIDWQTTNDITINEICIELVDITEQIKSPIKIKAIKQVKLNISL